MDQIINWKKIIGYENYEVSDAGDVRNSKTGRVLKKGIDTHGYHQLRLSNNGKVKTLRIHRLVGTAFMTNPDNKPCIDHIDNCKTNNHLTNLRFATCKENNRNVSMRSNNTSGNTGVSFDKNSQKWCAQIMIDRIKKHLGSFKDKDDAIEARVKAVNILFKDFAHSSQKR
jgi:hypothetical protein